MAKPRGRSRGPSGPRGTLGTLLRTTLAQAGVVRDVLERGAREGRARLDDVRRERRRGDALAKLGEAVLEAVRAGALADIYDVPDAADALAELEAMEDDGGGGERAPAGEHDEPPWVAPRTRERFDRRTPEPARDARADDDGTVSSASWRPRPPSGAAAVWRPPRDEAPAEPVARAAKPARPAGRDATREPGARFAEPAPRKGGIQFAPDDGADDDDLEQYMNPDDVPPKGNPPDGAG